MGLGDVLSKSVSYPFPDLTKFLILGLSLLIVDLDAISSEIFGQDSFIVLIAFIIAVLFSFVVAGYSITITKRAMENSREIPAFDIRNNFIDGIRLFIVEFVYYVIPVIITIVLLFVFGVLGQQWDKIVLTLGIWAIVAFILFVMSGIFAVVARARYSISRSVGDALNFGKVWEDVKRIGLVKIILFLVIAYIILFVLALILGVITVIPVIGTVVVDVLLGGFIFLFLSYGIGLLYYDWISYLFFFFSFFLNYFIYIPI